MVKIWALDDDWPEIHIAAGFNDYTICGHDTAGDELVHKRQPQFVEGFK